MLKPSPSLNRYAFQNQYKFKNVKTTNRYNNNNSNITPTDMKLAEALQIRADLQRRLAQMPIRLRNSATKQEGSAPVENPADLLKETDAILDQLEHLMNNINLTNSISTDSNGHSLTALIAKRDTLRKKIDIMRNFLNAASDLVPRSSSTDIRVLPTVNVPELRKRCDILSKDLRETDIKIQELNWTTELTE